MDELEAEALIRGVLKSHASLVDDEASEAVRHYIDHGEFEMAFEGLFLELSKAAQPIHDVPWGRVVSLCQQYDLADEFVFDQDIARKINNMASAASKLDSA